MCEEEEIQKNCRKEVKVMKECIHENVIKLENHSEQKIKGRNYFFIVTPLCQTSLQKKMLKMEEKKEIYETKKLKNHFKQVCLGLQILHKNKYVHRDLTANNVLFQSDDHLVIMDFGSVDHSCIEINDSRDAFALQELCESHSTISYRAPELLDVPKQIIITEKTGLFYFLFFIDFYFFLKKKKIRFLFIR